MFAFMAAINGLEIVGRGFFSVSFSWVQEVSILSAMWIYFFAYALIAKNEEYIRVDFAAKLMPEAWQYAVDIFVRLVTIFFQGMVAWFAVETYRFLGMFTTSVLIWPEFAVRAADPDRRGRYPHHRADLSLLGAHTPPAARPAPHAGRGGVAAWRRRS